MKEQINHPEHYNLHASGVEAILVVRTMSFNLGSAFKYIFRRDDKENLIQDLKKALWYTEDELEERKKCKTIFNVLRSFLRFYQNSYTQYWKRAGYVNKIVRWEPDEMIADIYRLLHEADCRYYDTKHLFIVAEKLRFIIDKYTAIENINKMLQ